MNPAKCLLVDDREENLVALEALLGGERLDIHRARSGAEGLELLLEHEFALALIDVQMPGMNGLELAELMRGTARTSAIPIIFVTAGGPDQTPVFKGYEAGAVDFLFKPLSAHVVKSKIRVFVELYEQRQTLRQQVQALRESEDAAKQALEARNRFISIAGHELRTPITVLRLQLSMAKRKFEGDPGAVTSAETSRLLDQLNRQVERLAPLVDDMLDASRIQSGKLRIQPEPFDLASLVDDVVDRFLPLLREAGCHAEVDCAAGAVGEWDRFRIEQVVCNLLSNAARYGGGCVRASLRCLEDEVELRVSDQGPGIPTEHQQRIFQPFERAGAERGKTGLGLGLHIVRQIVEMHGGSIRVDSKPGHGAAFIVRLPREPALQSSP